jgi:hypothetical protein
VRTPWEERKLKGPILFIEHDELKIISSTMIGDVIPASKKAT